MPISKKKRANSEYEDTIDYNKDDINAVSTIVHNDDPIFLSEIELKEEITRILTCTNPKIPKNIVKFSFRDLAYVKHFNNNHEQIHLYLESKLKPKHSDHDVYFDSSTIDDFYKDNQILSEICEQRSEKKLRNQFNFSDRATQVLTNGCKDASVLTVYPKRLSYSGQVTQWILYETYELDFNKTANSKDERNSVTYSKIDDKKVTPVANQISGDSRFNEIEKFHFSIKMIERMVNQNKNAEISHDFCYFEDESDQYRENGSGSVLPLWKFFHDIGIKLAVTCVKWNPFYSDLLAVSYGNYDFENLASEGMICFYSLKNVAHPELIFRTESGVMSFDFHPILVFIFCVGFYNGTVAIYNAKTTKKEPMFISSIDNGIHFGPVWSIKWIDSDVNVNLSFISCGSDGRITSWIIVKNEMSSYDVSTLKLKGFETSGLDAIDSALTFEFHPSEKNIYLVGTEEGFVHLCDKSYSGDYIKTFKAHSMPVYRVHWNTYHPDVFLSCSADWTLKIWLRTNEAPLVIYDLGSSIGDACWSNYSSTVFAAVSSDGKIYVYDINVNRYEALCSQQVVSKKRSRLTQISFNDKKPVVAVADDKIISNGSSRKLKNKTLLKIFQKKDKKGQEPKRGPVYEKNKIEKIINILK